MTNKGNGKDTSVVVVDGKATSKSTAVALRVKNANVTEEKGGGSTAVLTVVGRARIEQKTCGATVHLVTAGDNRKFLGRCVEVRVTAGKKEGERFFQAKVANVRAHNLDEIVGVQVSLDQAQGELPGVEDVGDQPSLKPATMSAEQLRALKPKDAETRVNPPRRPRGRGRGREARA